MITREIVYPKLNREPKPGSLALSIKIKPKEPILPFSELI